MEKRKRFTAEFKREAVRLLKKGGKPATVIARKFGIPCNRLYKWAQDTKTKGEEAFRGSGRPKAVANGVRFTYKRLIFCGRSVNESYAGESRR